MLIYRKCVVVQGQGEQINPKSDEIDKEVYILTFFALIANAHRSEAAVFP